MDLNLLPVFQVSSSGRLVSKICSLVSGLGYFTLLLIAIIAFFVFEAPVSYSVGGGAILLMILMPVSQITMFGYRYAFATIIAKLEESDWVGVEIEVSGTENKLAIIAPDKGILIRGNNQLRLISEKGMNCILTIDTTTFKRVGKSFTCAVQCFDVGGNDLLGYVMTIVYKGQDMSVGASGDKRYEHFLSWLGKSNLLPPPLPK